jgi:hypothetical protein
MPCSRVAGTWEKSTVNGLIQGDRDSAVPELAEGVAEAVALGQLEEELPRDMVGVKLPVGVMVGVVRGLTEGVSVPVRLVLGVFDALLEVVGEPDVVGLVLPVRANRVGVREGEDVLDGTGALVGVTVALADRVGLGVLVDVCEEVGVTVAL